MFRMFEVNIFVPLASGVSSCLCSVCDIISWDTVAFFAFSPVRTIDMRLLMRAVSSGCQFVFVLT